MAAGQEASKSANPADLVKSVVKAIDEHYLHARANAKWNIAKDAMLAGKYPDSIQAFKMVQQQLPVLEDPELNALTPQQIAAVQGEALGEKIGLGLYDFCIDMEIESGRARVVTPVVGSPAMKSGIQPGDVIVSINGKPTGDMNHEQVMDALRSQGTGGTHLEILRSEKTLRLTVQPSAEKLQAVYSARRQIKGKNIGYVRVAQFTPDVANAVREAVNKLEQSDVDGYVLDLRNNPGGFLNAARDVGGIFATGTLGFTVHSDGNRQPIEAQGKPLTQKPVAVLVNAGTASAAEVLSGGLQGLHRAALVGEKTYGRGQAQIFVPLADGYGIQIPSVQLLTPNERPFKEKGIEPDVQLPEAQLPEAELGGLRDRQFQRAAAAILQQ